MDIMYFFCTNVCVLYIDTLHIYMPKPHHTCWDTRLHLLGYASLDSPQVIVALAGCSSPSFSIIWVRICMQEGAHLPPVTCLQS